MKKLLILISCVLLILSVAAQIAAAKEVKIDDLINGVLQKDESYNSLSVSGSQYQWSLKSYQTFILPTISLNVNDQNLIGEHNVSWNFNIEKVLYDSGELKNTIAKEKLKIQVNDLEQQDARNRIIVNILIYLKDFETTNKICNLLTQYEKEIIKYSNTPNFEQYYLQFKSSKTYWEQKRRYISEDLFEGTGFKVIATDKDLAMPELPANLIETLDKAVLASPNIQAVLLINDLRECEAKSRFFYNLPRLTGNIRLNGNQNNSCDWEITLNYTQKLSKWINLNFGTTVDDEDVGGSLNLYFTRTLATEPDFYADQTDVAQEDQIASSKKNIVRMLDQLEIGNLTLQEQSLGLNNAMMAYDYDPTLSTLLYMMNADISVLTSIMSLYQSKVQILKEINLLDAYVSTITNSFLIQ